MKISIEPPLPEAEPWKPEIHLPLSKIFWKMHDRDHPPFDMVYKFKCGTIRYYPTNLGEIMDDLLREYRLTSKAMDHFVEFSGYPIAFAEINEKTIIFKNASLRRDTEPELGRARVQDYLGEIERVIGAALNYAERLANN